MPVGLVVFEISAPSWRYVRRLRAKIYSEAHLFGKRLRQCLSELRSKARPNTITLLLLSIAFYLVLSRCGPVLTKIGETTFDTFDLNRRLLQNLNPVDLRSLKGVYKIFRGVTRVPGPFAHRYFNVVYYIMGNKKSRLSSDEGHQQHQESDGEGVTVKEAKNVSSEPPTKSSSEGSKKGSEYVKLSAIEDEIKMGSLAILKRTNQDIRHYAVFIQHDKCDPEFPLMLVKGKTKPMHCFDPKMTRHAHMVSAASRIYYGDYETVAVRFLKTDLDISCQKMVSYVDEMAEIPFSDAEMKAITEAASPEKRSAIVCTFMVAHFYKKLGVLDGSVEAITPGHLEDHLDLEEPMYIELPGVKEGPIAHGDPPFLSRLVASEDACAAHASSEDKQDIESDGIFPPADIVTHQLSNLIPNLDTGDLVLFSGATSSGALIKFFDHSEFSHIGIVLRTQYSSHVLVWEASTNKAGLVDVESGDVLNGVELLPLRNKIFSGWYDRVAIRRLTGIDKEKRKEIYQQLLHFRKEVQGRPYETSKMELVLSAIDFKEEYLTFLSNTKEDLSSLFCSELVAEAYKRMGLLVTDKLSNEFTPDDFTSKNAKHLNLSMGKLETEQYVELKFDMCVPGMGTM